MIRNYFRVALRNLLRHKFFSGINIFGLAISMALCLAIVMLVADQMMYDRYNTNRERIYRVTTAKTDRKGAERENPFATAPLPLSETLKNEYTGIEKIVRIRRGFGNGWMKLEQQDINIPVSGYFVDADALSLFQYKLEHGDAETALTKPYSVVLTKKTAQKLFKKDNPIGEVIKVGKLGEYTVTGVLEDNGNKSHIVFDALASWSTLKSLNEKGDLKNDDTNWNSSYSGWTYLLIEEGHTPHEIEEHLVDIAKRHKPDASSSGEERLYRYALQNISAITPGAFINNPIGPFMPMIFVYFFGGLALIVMLTSCFNYTSLSIARALTRAREIGVRKVNGAHRYQIFLQFLSESVIVAMFSLGIALLLLFLIKPLLLKMKFVQLMHWDLEGNIYVYSFFVLFTIVTGLIAGFFPAVILSKFQPVKVLKAAGNMRLFSRLGLRKSLLVIQFSLSLIFIISVTLLYSQLNLFIQADHGFTMANKINIRLNNTSYKTLRNELSQYANLTDVSAASHIPAAGMTYGGAFKKNLSETDIVNMNYFFTDEQYLANMGVALIAGRTFDAAQEKTNVGNIIINQQAVKAFNFSNLPRTLSETLSTYQATRQNFRSSVSLKIIITRF